MYRKILLALFACLAIAVPVGAAMASDEAADDSPVASTDEGAPPAPDALPPAGNYTFTVSPKSTVTLAVCKSSQWGKLPNGKLSTFEGTVDANGHINIPGPGLKGQFPKIKLNTCDGADAGWFLGEPTGGHDNRYTPSKDWNGDLVEKTGKASLNAPINSTSKVSTLLGEANCWVGETKKDGGGYSDFINLNLNKGSYTTSGNKVSVKHLTNTIPFTLPSPFEAVAPNKNQPVCSLVEGILSLTDIPVAYDLTINGTKTG